MNEKGEQALVKVGQVNYIADITVREHKLVADEPVTLGGADKGPNPYELLLSSLGACTAMTLRIYAGRKDWPLEEVSVQLSHTKDYVEDCEDCDEKDLKIDRIVKKIELKGDLSEEQRKRLMQIADRCPVNKTLLGEIKIESQEWKPTEV
ncbi:MAG TPA: osmotically inducible protein C [Flavobacteriales bacterium]|nr:osmotically inducible protein C [Flavobacteriales bacterium]